MVIGGGYTGICAAIQAGRLVKEYSVEIMENGEWKTIVNKTENYIRKNKIKLEPPVLTNKIRLTVHAMWKNSEPARVCAIEIY